MRSVPEGARTLVLLGLLVALAGAPTGVAGYETHVLTRVTVSGEDPGPCKDLLVSVEVCDENDRVLASCCWDGRLNSLGDVRVSENRLDRAVDDFVILLTVRYGGQTLLVERTTVHVIPGLEVLLELGNRTVELGVRGFGSTWEMQEPITTTRTIDGRTIEITLHPSAEATLRELDSGRRGTCLIYRVRGEVTVRDERGDHWYSLEALVECTTCHQVKPGQVEERETETVPMVPLPPVPPGRRARHRSGAS